jgi:hypothetical protein
MRSSISLAVLATVAAPVLSATTLAPVTQISDGQIQAPPATSSASYASSAATVVPTSAVTVVPTSAVTVSYSTPTVGVPVVSSVTPVGPAVSSYVVAPSYSSGNTSVAVTIPTYTNTTLTYVSVGPSTATVPAGTTAGGVSGTSAKASATSTGAADTAFGSPLAALSYLAVAVAGFFLA